MSAGPDAKRPQCLDGSEAAGSPADQDTSVNCVTWLSDKGENLKSQLKSCICLIIQESMEKIGSLEIEVIDQNLQPDQDQDNACDDLDILPEMLAKTPAQIDSAGR